MAFDLVLRNATLPDGRTGIDLGVTQGRIAAMAPNLPATPGRDYECAGRLVSPPFVDAHFHLDSALGLGEHVNHSGTLLEGIALWGRIKPSLTVEAVVERALAYCDLAVSQGLLAIRSHVDVCDDRLVAVEALLHVREKVKDYIDLQLVAFPQDGFRRSATAAANLTRALDMGVDVVGGIPHFERTRSEGDASLADLCRIAAERGLLMDVHCDETDDPESRHVETLAHQARHFGLQGRVVGSHLTSMHGFPGAYTAKLFPLMAEAGLGAICNPLINLTLQGRFDHYPKRRGVTQVPELLAAGIPVAFGQDCVRDPWYGLGSGDMLEVAHMGLHACQMTSAEQMRTCFEAVTTLPARLMHLSGYGLAIGCHADFVVLQARDPADALRLRAPRLAVFRRGKLLAERPPAETALHLPGRPSHLRTAP